ncbi:MAG: transposase [Deltaproteobacteria bacterium]|nr:transposase [Deltaproteobacteria bacterium]
MKLERRVCYRYSSAFKQKVVSEIESGEISIVEAQRIYGINGAATIPAWIKKLGKNHLLCRVVRVEMKDEKDRIKELKKQIQQLESALAKEHIKNIALESLIESAEEYYKEDLKKSFGGKGSKKEEKK